MAGLLCAVLVQAAVLATAAALAAGAWHLGARLPTAARLAVTLAAVAVTGAVIYPLILTLMKGILT